MAIVVLGIGTTLGAIAFVLLSAARRRLILQVHRNDEVEQTLRLRARERLLAEVRRREVEVGFRSLIEMSPDGTIMARGGRVLYANPAMAATLGYEDEQAMVGMWLSALLPEDERNRGREVAVRAMEEGVMRGVELKARRADGDAVPLEVTAFRISVDGIPSLVAIARDLGDWKRVQSQLAVSDRMATVGTLAAGVAHEINNPLTFVLANLNAALEDLPDLFEGKGTPGVMKQEELLQALSDARDGAVRVRDIVKAMKTFSRSADDDPRQPVEVNAVVEDALRMLRTEIKFRARIVEELEPVPAVDGNPGRMAQVIVNLLVNAAHAIDEGAPEKNEIRIATGQSDGDIFVRVSDTGKGIDPLALRRIFEPFFTTKAPGVGTGMGLSICHQIIRAHSGTIEVESEPGKGSTFTVWLPAIGGAAMARSRA